MSSQDVMPSFSRAIASHTRRSVHVHLLGLEDHIVDNSSLQCLDPVKSALCEADARFNAALLGGDRKLEDFAFYVREALWAILYNVTVLDPECAESVDFFREEIEQYKTRSQVPRGQKLLQTLNDSLDELDLIMRERKCGDFLKIRGARGLIS